MTCERKLSKSPKINEKTWEQNAKTWLLSAPIKIWNLVVSLQQKSSNDLTLSAPLKAGKDSQRFKLPARHGLKLCQNPRCCDFPNQEVSRLPKGPSKQRVFDSRHVGDSRNLLSAKLQAGRSNDLETYKIIIFGIGFFDVVGCKSPFSSTSSATFESNWIWPRSLPSATPKARCLPTSSPSLVNKTPCCCVQHFYHLSLLAAVSPNFRRPSASASLLLLRQLNWSCSAKCVKVQDC